MSENVAIKVVGLGKRFERTSQEGSTKSDDPEGFWALRNLSFEIKKGESVGIIGPNGSGKSTLLKILAGVTRPTEGRVEIVGRVASILEIGSGFHPELSGRENIHLNGSILGFSKKEITPHVKDIIDFSGIGEFIDEPVKNYSSGMYVRLAFSIMAHLPFDIYLLDEVMAVGDIRFQEKVRLKMTEFGVTGRTVLLASHSLTETRGFNRFIVVDGGKPIRNFFSGADYQRYAESLVDFSQSIPLSNTNLHISDFSKYTQSETIEMEYVSFVQQGNDLFNVANPFELTIRFRKLRHAKTAAVVYFSDFQDNVIFSTAPFIKNGFTESAEIGRYTYSCQIPAYIFGPHTCRVTVLFLLNPKGAFRPPAVLEGSTTKLMPEGMKIALALPNVFAFRPCMFNDGVAADLTELKVQGQLLMGFQWQIDRMDTAARKIL